MNLRLPDSLKAFVESQDCQEGIRIGKRLPGSPDPGGSGEGRERRDRRQVAGGSPGRAGVSGDPRNLGRRGTGRL